MTGGDLQGSGSHGEEPRLSRRDFTRLGAFAGGVVWGAPKVTSIQFANRAIGTPTGPTTTPTTEPPPTTTPQSTTSTTTTTTTTTVPDSTTTTVPDSTTTVPGSTTPPTVSPQSTVPGGTTTTTAPGETTTSTIVNQGTTVPGSTTPPTVSPQSSVPSGPKDPGEGPYNGGNGSGGVLSFTGADTADLAVVGATAIVLGRALYVLGRRPAEEDEIAGGAIPPVTP